MRSKYPLEQSLGMEFYSTEVPGVGGRLKARFEDFQVEEITPTGDILQIQDLSDAESLTEAATSISGAPKKYAQFTVQKMGLTTLDVVNILAAELGISRHLVSYAGLKDKRAITTQAMSVPAKSATAFSELQLFQIALRDPHYVSAPVRVGDLWGNRFSILLRDIESEETSLKAAEAVRTTPLLNYFGEQRFGVVRPYTHLVGKAAVKRDFRGAIRTMLTTTSQYEDEQITSLRKELAEELVFDESVLQMLPDGLRYEKNVAEFLTKNPGEYARAFRQIPPRIRTLFVHAYQSYLFNRLISKRHEAGLPLDRPIPGDFLIQLDRPHSGRDSWLYVTEKNLDERTTLVEAGQFGIAAPVPGYATKMPPSPQTDTLRAILDNEGITLLDFRNEGSRAIDSAGGLHLLSISVPGLEDEFVDRGLHLRFRLRKGSYATVVLREIMKNHPIERV